ncbi:MAG: cyclic pyranopterin monophosphate synthase MoaC [Hyphomicrobiales bacterium]|nr:cyclic pyranopterin monophosphate synthase MoaC [Hyphomicrobiales bacterium]MCY4032895.1 cyclic pyranopterin monophosphate synthase MoaC [Hyphomicrobiales bacterium]MCY4039197.1 cyclic pyranopterin monophosphate synthase MoaC [Hyphomicrobiales bacterium]
MKLSHLDEHGAARMVDVSDKDDTHRTAVAQGRITMKRETLEQIQGGGIAKGDVLATARLAGILAAKRTSDAIPLCHPLTLTSVELQLAACEKDVPAIEVTATVRSKGPTGVEMEALHAVTVACLTVYDMAKAVDRAMHIGDIRLLKKSGGKSGEWSAP